MILSVLVPGLYGYEGVRAVLLALLGQSDRDRLEIIVLCRSAAELLAPPEVLSQLDQVLEVGSALLHDARVLGVKASRGQYVFLAEDHCLPEPGWATRLLERMEQGWEVVGPSLQMGAHNWIAQSNFLLGYGQWFCPGPPAEAPLVPAVNSAYRLEALRKLEGGLNDDLLMPVFLQKRLRQRGARMFLESRAQMRHYDCTRFGGSVATIFFAGLGFGSRRSRDWSRAARLGFAVAFCGVALLHLRRAALQYFRVRGRGYSGMGLLGCAFFALVWGVGEACGSLIGMTRAAPWVAHCELNRWKYLSPEECP